MADPKKSDLIPTFVDIEEAEERPDQSEAPEWDDGIRYRRTTTKTSESR